MKIGMLNLHKVLRQNRLDSKILLQIHDELIISTPQDQAEKTAGLVKSTLEEVVKWQVPLTVNLNEGSNWKEVTK